MSLGDIEDVVLFVLLADTAGMSYPVQSYGEKLKTAAIIGFACMDVESVPLSIRLAVVYKLFVRQCSYYMALHCC